MIWKCNGTNPLLIVVCVYLSVIIFPKKGVWIPLTDQDLNKLKKIPRQLHYQGCSKVNAFRSLSQFSSSQLSPSFLTLYSKFIHYYCFLQVFLASISSCDVLEILSKTTQKENQRRHMGNKMLRVEIYRKAKDNSLNFPCSKHSPCKASADSICLLNFTINSGNA